jgi:hypothetical protein
LAGLRREWVWACLFYLLLACFWFFPLLRGDQIGQSYTNFSYVPYYASLPSERLPPRSMAQDAALTFYPWARVARDQLRDGSLPLWNPYEYGGTTLVGNFQSALFSPLNWPLLVLPLGVAFGVVALLKLVVAGLGAYALARTLDSGREGAFLAGIIYMLCAPLIAWVQWPSSAVFALFPWVLLSVWRVYRDASCQAVAGLGLAIGLTVLAGHPESALLSLSATAVFAAALSTRSERWLRVSALCVGGAALGTAISAVATLPFLEALAASVTRSGFFHVTELPLERGLALAMPQLFGDGELGTGEMQGLYGMAYLNEDIAIWFGLPALIFACTAVRAWRRPGVLAVAAVGVVALAAMFGIPPVSWLFEHVKPWSMTTLGARIGFVVALVGAVAAGLGFGDLANRPISIRGAIAIVAGVAVVFGVGYLLANGSGALEAPADVKRDAIRTGVLTLAGCGVLLLAAGRLPRAPVAIVTAVLVMLSLGSLRDFNVFLPPEIAYPPEPAALKALHGESGRVGVLPTGTAPDVPPPNILSTYGLSTLEGYDFPLSRRWSYFQSGVLGFRSLRPEYAHATEIPTQQNLTGMRMFNTRFYLAAPGSKPPFDGFDVYYDGPDATIFRDRLALPRAFVVNSVRQVPEAETIDELLTGGIDFRREAIVPEGSGIEESSNRSPRTARAVQVSGDRVRVTLGEGGPGWLVLADAYAPNWKAKIDDEDVEARPTNYAAMGVPVSSSARVVEFYLDRTSLWVGAAITLLALCLTIALAAWPRIASRFV